MKKIEKMFQVGGKISGRSGYRKHNIFFATPDHNTILIKSYLNKPPNQVNSSVLKRDLRDSNLRLFGQ